MHYLFWCQILGTGIILSLIIYFIKWIYSTFVRQVNFDVYKSKTADTFVLITGAANGIGLAYARAFARRGFNLLLLDKNVGKFPQLKEELESDGVRVVTIESDAIEDSKPKNMTALLERVKDYDIGILVNNVGRAVANPTLFGENDQTEIYNLIQINCTFATLLTSGLLPMLKARAKHTRTAIINMSSVSGHFKWAWNVVYSATKAYMWGFSRSLSVECLPHGIDVLTVSPGYVETEMTGKSTSLFVCHPDECVEYTLRKMGYEDIIPHWKHILMYYPVKILSDIIVPTRWQLWVSDRTEMFKMRPRYDESKTLKDE